MKIRSMFRSCVVLLFFSLLMFQSLTAQVYEKKIFEYIRLVSEGQSDLIQSKIIDLKKKIPRSAGIIYIEGLISSDENVSLRCFHVIVDSFPRSEWADDALARLFEYHMRVGSPSDAERSYQLLQSEYPGSPYLTTGYLRQERLSQENLTYNRSLPRIQGQEWAIQIGAFSIRENAEKLQQKFV
ncbi:MAG: hypothetical protein HY800_01240, partial [Ignavibacteriales bacterium]|nr:hypothetical protein [Ignavibacteriales bacterium]